MAVVPAVVAYVLVSWLRALLPTPGAAQHCLRTRQRLCQGGAEPKQWGRHHLKIPMPSRSPRSETHGRTRLAGKLTFNVDTSDTGERTRQQ